MSSVSSASLEDALLEGFLALQLRGRVTICAGFPCGARLLWLARSSSTFGGSGETGEMGWSEHSAFVGSGALSPGSGMGKGIVPSL